MADPIFIERLPAASHEWIDRDQRLWFSFEGRRHCAYAGDTISSALWGNGVRLLGRSFKYHRPRGVYSMCAHDANVMLENGETLNIRGDTTLVEDGMDLTAVNTVGSLRWDLAGLTDRMSGFLPVGFYYKAFHTPNWMFPNWERMIRDIAGLGKVNPAAEWKPSPKGYDACDVLIIGGGPSGMAAALAAGGAGSRVVLVEDTRCLGGSLCYAGATAPESVATINSMRDELEKLENVEIRLNTSVRGCYSENWLAIIGPGGMTKMRATAVVVATGAYEQPAVFRHNDLPGVMLGTAAQRLAHLYRVKPMQRALVLVGSDYGYGVALDLKAAGVEIAAVADFRETIGKGELVHDVKTAGIEILAGQGVYEARPAGGLLGIKGARVCPVNADGTCISTSGINVNCDGIVMATGWAPAGDLIGQAGGRLNYVQDAAQFRPDELPPGMFAAGRVNGVFGVGARVEDGGHAGGQAAAFAAGKELPARRRPTDEIIAPSYSYPIVKHPRGKAFVDLDEDVQVKDIVNAAKEGYDSVELVKRYTTVGMGPSQGKISNLNSSRILAKATGQTMGAVGYTTFRPFTQPTTIGELAGRRFHPDRRTPIHSRHQAAGAVFMHAGAWLRPEYYGPRVRHQAIVHEVQAVRRSAGIIDVGTLGKIDVCGADAAEFLERMYTGRFSDLKLGRSRYALMCDESGVVIDDGMSARFGDDRFYVTTTSSGSAAIVREMKRWAIIWGLEVTIIDHTGQFGALNLAGPESRNILGRLTDLDISAGGFEYLGFREAVVAGVNCRLMRVGFVGELGYELHVPAQHAAALWDAVIEAGQPEGIMPFGVEAQRLLRMEKGHQIIGQDTDGLTTPLEAGLAWAVKMTKPFFIGQRSLKIVEPRPNVRALAGFVMHDSTVMPSECHLVVDGDEICGRVTSIARSPTLGQVIGMAYMRPDQTTPGTVIDIRVEGRLVQAEVAKLPFYDPSNERQKS